MSDFFLEPDEIEPDSPARSRPVRLVTTGLAPTAEVPASARRGPAPPPCYAPCEACGAPVLRGQTRTGTRLAMDVHVLTYCVLWENGAGMPLLEQSRGYPVHWCGPGATSRTP